MRLKLDEFEPQRCRAMPRGRARCDDVRDQALGGAADEQVFSLSPEGRVLITRDRDLSQVLPRIHLSRDE